MCKSKDSRPIYIRYFRPINFAFKMERYIEKDYSSNCNTTDCTTQLLDMPNEILMKILKFFCKTELSVIISNICLKLFDICQTLLNGRLTIIDYELKQIQGQNLYEDFLAHCLCQPLPLQMIQSLLEKKHFNEPISYCIFHYNNYWTTDPRSLESTYEWLEVNECLLECEKARDLGIYFVFSDISSYKIAQLVLENCLYLKQFYWYGEWPSYLENHLANRTSLELVSIKSPSFETYKSLPKLAVNCEKLTYINLHIRHSYLSSCNWKLDVLGMNLRNLRHLSLSGTHNKYYESTFSKLFESLDLSTVRLHEIGLGENTLKAIANTQKNLEVLSLDDGKSILCSEENSAIHSLSYTIRKVESTKQALFDTGFEDNLRMAMSEGVIDLDDYQLNDEVNVEYIPEILLNCDKLRNLTLRIKVLDDHKLKQINSCIKLESLDLKYCDKLSDQTLSEIVTSCEQLRNINLTECKNITDSGIRTLTKRCPKMSCLNISFCAKLTDDSLISVSRNSKILSNLNVSYCSNMTMYGISLVLKKCKKLNILYITGCKLDEKARLDLESCTRHVLELKKYNDLIKINDNRSNGIVSVISNVEFDEEYGSNEDGEDGDDFW